MADSAVLADTVWERLQTLQADLNVYDGVVPKGPGQKYATYYPGAGSPYSDRHSGTPRTFTWAFFVVCAGTTRAQTLDAAERVRSALLGWRPDPADAAGPLEEVDLGNDLIRDDAGLLSFTLRYTLTTTRS